MKKLFSVGLWEMFVFAIKVNVRWVVSSRDTIEQSLIYTWFLLLHEVTFNLQDGKHFIGINNNLAVVSTVLVFITQTSLRWSHPFKGAQSDFSVFSDFLSPDICSFIWPLMMCVNLLMTKGLPTLLLTLVLSVFLFLEKRFGKVSNFHPWCYTMMYKLRLNWQAWISAPLDSTLVSPVIMLKSSNEWKPMMIKSKENKFCKLKHLK